MYDKKGKTMLQPFNRHILITPEFVEREKKIKFEAQLSLIGGTMGLLTGFSIISGVEICWFIAKVLCGILERVKARMLDSV